MARTEEQTLTQAVSRDGTEIGYFTGGEGPQLVLVHGSLGDHTRWSAMLPYLEPHFTVHALNRRGRGASGDHPDYDFSCEVEDVVAVVDAVAEETGAKVDVMGSSVGASFSLQAASLTTSIGRLVLVGGATPRPYVSTAKAVTEAVPTARIVILEGQNHGAEMFAPAVVAEPVLAFLRE